MKNIKQKRYITRRNFLNISAVAAAGVALVGCGGPSSNTPDSGGDDNLYDAIIVGGGLAGLTAARELVNAGQTNILVLEARDRVGGRTVNQTVAGGAVVEGGGQWVGPTQTEILALAEELGVDTFPTYNTGEAVFYFEGFRFLESQVPVDPVEQADLTQAKAALEMLAKTVPVDAPWDAPNAAALDAMTVADWLSANTTTSGARQELELELATTLSGAPQQISLLYYLFYIASAGGLDALGDIEGGAQEARFVGGSQILSLRMAEQLGDVVRLGAPVTAIDTSSDTAVLQTGAGTFRARRVVFALMPALADRISFTPALPDNRAELAAQWPTTGTGYKAHLSYDAPFWRDQNLSGLAITDDPKVEVTFDNSPPDGSQGVLLVFADPRFLPDGADARQQELAQALVPVFGQAAGSPTGFVDQDWGTEMYTAGCVSPVGPGVLTSYGPALRAPVGIIHWAGTETSPIWTGYMEGAVRSGKRVAQELLDVL